MRTVLPPFSSKIPVVVFEPITLLHQFSFEPVYPFDYKFMLVAVGRWLLREGMVDTWGFTVLLLFFAKFGKSQTFAVLLLELLVDPVSVIEVGAKVTSFVAGSDSKINLNIYTTGCPLIGLNLIKLI